MQGRRTTSRLNTHASRTHATRRRVGVVVPALDQGGGVQSVAEFVCETIESSGASDLVLVSLSAAARDDLGVAVTRPSSWLRGVVTAEGTWRGRSFTRVGVSGSEFEFRRYQPRPPLTAALAGCDLIQVVSGSPAPACAVCGLGMPVAVLCATRAVVERSSCSRAGGLASVWRRWMTAVTDRMDRKALQSVDAIQVMNGWMLDYARQVSAERDVVISLVPPGINALRFKPAQPRDVRSDPYILCVGRLSDPRKNVGLLFRAFAMLPPALKSTTRLVLAGAVGPTADDWRLVETLGIAGRVSFTASPSPDALIALYQSASVLALTSYEEGFGMVILEAMACGIPVVSTRSGGPDEIVRDGLDGYLVGIDDVAGFAGRLTWLLSDESLNRKMGEAGRRSVLSTFDSRVAAQALLKTHEALLEGRMRVDTSAWS